MRRDLNLGSRNSISVQKNISLFLTSVFAEGCSYTAPLELCDSAKQSRDVCGHFKLSYASRVEVYKVHRDENVFETTQKKTKISKKSSRFLMSANIF